MNKSKWISLNYYKNKKTFMNKTVKKCKGKKVGEASEEAEAVG